MTQKTFYITTAIHYVNGPPHIGHAYENIAADVLARFKRLDGYDTYFLTGTDEHGQKVQKAAAAKGMPPQEFCDEIAATFVDMCEQLHITQDQFIRTTSGFHKAAAQALWKKMEDAGDIYLDKYAGWYSVRDEAFYGEDETQLRPDGNRVASATGTEVEWTEEESYFFRLSAYGERLLKLYEDNPEFIEPAFRRNEVASFVKQGLRDLSISRTSFDWGVPVPGSEHHIMYVWVDALVNYISALGYPDVADSRFKTYWPCSVHVIGKDIVRFHAIYWPAFLMSVGIALPERIFGHGHLIIEGEKMSKSLGNVIAPSDLMARYGVDAARYALMREIPFGNDGDFAHTSVVNRINAELANNIGNLVQRTLSMIAKNCEGKVPEHGDLTADDTALLEQVGANLLDAVRGEMDKLQFSKAIDHIVQAANAANLYIDAQAPWKLKKEDPARMATVLYVLAEAIRNLGLIMQPFTPTAAVKILEQVAVADNAHGLSFMGEAHRLKPGTPLPAPAGVFPRLVAEEVAA